MQGTLKGLLAGLAAPDLLLLAGMDGASAEIREGSRPCADESSAIW